MNGQAGKEARNPIAKAWFGLFFFLAVVGFALFVPAGTVRYWQAWLYVALYSVSVGAITLYLMRNDRALLERRIAAGPGAEKRTKQKIIQFIAQFAFLAVLVVPALDHRFAWSDVPSYAVITGDGLVLLGLYVVFRVFRENTFASATIEIGKEQKVVSTGPYALVRHPMYGGAFVMLIGTPIALGSWWGLLAIFPITAAVIWRLFDEEEFLAKSLQGYAEYRAKVRWRLIPGVF
ncbi:MAG: methyltransferase family protein [Candidatus Acidiferrales bacterium]